MSSSMTNEFSDAELLHKWMNDPRVAEYWGEQGDLSHQKHFLTRALSSRHSIPIIGCWDGKPFGYFEIYWVKEDALGQLMGDAGNFDRGIHCLVGEQEFRGPRRFKAWLSALLHHCWLADNRTEVVLMEPRVDNEK
jgi:RimJ/RimL family protein N-acetyltransferase